MLIFFVLSFYLLELHFLGGLVDEGLDYLLIDPQTPQWRRPLRARRRSCEIQVDFVARAQDEDGVVLGRVQDVDVGPGCIRSRVRKSRMGSNQRP